LDSAWRKGYAAFGAMGVERKLLTLPFRGGPTAVFSWAGKERLQSDAGFRNFCRGKKGEVISQEVIYIYTGRAASPQNFLKKRNDSRS